MKVTQYPEINQLLDLLLLEMKHILDNKLVGLYLFGSLVTGDFDYEISDIDLLAAICSGLNEVEFEQLDKMHQDLIKNNTEWEDRIEIGYMSLENLRKPIINCNMALISPGEPFHIKKAENDWVLNRFTVREEGIALYGPAPETLIDPIPREVLESSLQELMKEWREWIKNTEMVRSRNYQAYMILTMCRALYSFRTGDFVSKKRAARWAIEELPAWSSLIKSALIWRENWRDKQVDHDATLKDTLKLVNFVIDEIVKE